MPTSKQNISIATIEKEIYKTFEYFKQEKNICLADFIEKFDISTIKHHKYRKIKFSYELLIRFILFQRLKKFKFITQTRQYLKNHPEEAIQLGFKELPNRRQIGYFQNHIPGNETKELLDFIIDKIEEITDKFGINLDIITIQPIKPKEMVGRLNSVIRGWGNYFKIGNVRWLFTILDRWTRTRVRTFIEKKKSGFARIRISKYVLKSEYNLTSLMTLVKPHSL